MKGVLKNRAGVDDTRFVFNWFSLHPGSVFVY